MHESLPQPVSSRPKRGRRLGTLVGLAIAVSLAGACGGSDASDLFRSTGEPLRLSIGEVEDMVTFVSAEAGRDWIRPPVIVVQNADDFSAGLQRDVEDEQAATESLTITTRKLQALGLTDLSVTQLQAQVDEFVTSSTGILAYYDPTADEIYLPVDTQVLDNLRGTLVHELGHALDGQYVDLQALLDERIANPRDDNAGLTAVLEGRAQALENRWRAETGIAAQPPTEPPPALPLPMLNQVVLPYVRGAVFIEALGGPAATWGLYDAPPESSEQFLFPDRYPDDVPQQVALPEADGPVLAEFEVGALEVFTWLVGDQLQDEDVVNGAGRAAQGLGGGSGVLWGDDEQSCFRAVFVADEPDDGMELFEAMDVWAAKGPGRTVVVMENQMIVTGCAPLDL